MKNYFIYVTLSILLFSSCRSMQFENTVVENSKKPEAKVALSQIDYEFRDKRGFGANSTTTTTVVRETTVKNKSMDKSCNLLNVKELKILLPNKNSVMYIDKYAHNRKKYKILLLTSVVGFVGGLFILGSGHPVEYDNPTIGEYKPARVFGGGALALVSAVSVFIQVPMKTRNQRNLFKAVDVYNRNL